MVDIPGLINVAVNKIFSSYPSSVLKSHAESYVFISWASVEEDGRRRRKQKSCYLHFMSGGKKSFTSWLSHLSEITRDAE